MKKHCVSFSKILVQSRWLCVFEMLLPVRGQSCVEIVNLKALFAWSGFGFFNCVSVVGREAVDRGACLCHALQGNTWEAGCALHEKITWNFNSTERF